MCLTWSPSEYHQQMDGPNDAQLYLDAVDGSEIAFKQIVERFSDELIRYAMNHGINEDAARDATQNAWLRFVNHLRACRDNPDKKMEDPSRLLFYLMKVVKNTVRDSFRSVQRDRRKEQLIQNVVVVDQQLADTNAPGKNLEREQIQARVQRCIRQLGEPCKELVALLLIEPALEYRELAELLGRPIGWVGPTKARCLEKLRRTLEASQT